MIEQTSNGVYKLVHTETLTSASLVKRTGELVPPETPPDTVGRLLREADELYKSCRYDDAEKRSLQLVDVAQGFEDYYYCSQAKALFIAGMSQEKQRKYQESLSSFKKMLDLPQTQSNQKTVQRWANRGIGLVHEGTSQYRLAIEHYNTSLKIAQEEEYKPGQAEAHCDLGRAHVGLGQHEEAIAHHKEDLKIATTLDDKSRKGIAYGNLGAAHVGLGQYKEAIRYLRDSIDIVKELDDTLYVNELERFALVHLEVGEWKQAADLFTELKDKTEALGLEMLRCSALSGLGSARLRMGEHNEALSHHVKELRIAMKLNHEPSLARAYSGLGCCHMELENYTDAIEFHKKDMEISKDRECQSGLRRAHSNLGDVYMRMGTYEKAIEYHQENLKMARQLKDRPAEIRARASLGLGRFRSGNPAQAFRHFTKFEDLLCKLEGQLVEGRWRRHLPGFVESYADCMDAWVAAAAQADDMLEALRVEEWRRCRSELPYLAEDGNGSGGASSEASQNTETDKDVMTKMLEDIAKNADASFIIIFKMHENTLLTWVLSGETGKLVYEDKMDTEKQGCMISEWVASTTFTEWTRWYRALIRARQEIVKREKESGQVLGEEELENLIEEIIPTDMKGELDDKLWTAIRDPRIFREAAFGQNKVVVDLQDHYFDTANFALDQLSAVLWEPILEKCQLLKEYLKVGSECTKSVSRTRNHI